MKKLLLGAMLAAACFSDVDASVFQTKASKNNVDVILKEDMGSYYKGMVNLVNALLVGWADSLSYAAKDSDFKVEKTQLSNAGKKLKIIAKFTESMLNRDREKGITSNQSKAVAAAQAFQTVVNQLKNTEYWKHCGAQLRFSIIVITNSLQSLARKDDQFYVAGARVSSSQGLIDGNGYSVNYDLADDNVLIRDDSASGTSKVSNILSVFKEISRDLAITSVNTNVKAPLYDSTTDVASVATQVQSTAVSVSSPTVSSVQNAVSTPTVNTLVQSGSVPTVNSTPTASTLVRSNSVPTVNSTPTVSTPVRSNSVPVVRARR
ncbi:MAG: hypothetical protein J5821_01925 [Alphaproteobacteria bacterium]|nr:hypothetical protein [Alphaproteobacteria bacterium]